MLTFFLKGGGERVAHTVLWTYCANCPKVLMCAFFFPSLHAVNAQYPNPNCAHVPVGAACTEEPVFNISSKLKGEVLYFSVRNGSALTEGRYHCFSLLSAVYHLLVLFGNPSSCAKLFETKYFSFLISPSWKVKPRNKKWPTLKLSFFLFFLLSTQ